MRDGSGISAAASLPFRAIALMSAAILMKANQRHVRLAGSANSRQSSFVVFFVQYDF
jgi:hypothetical protein